MTSSGHTDTFGNVLDHVGYARGAILASSVDEAKRLQHAQAITADRVRNHGVESIAIFTGNQRDFPLTPEDLDGLAEEWVGPSLYAELLREVGSTHLGGDDSTAVAVFNRTSAGIVASILALAKERRFVSVVPDGGRSHASVLRGAWLARAEVSEVSVAEDWQSEISRVGPSLVIVTPVTSSLERIEDSDIRKVVNFSRQKNIPVLLDEAYGARLRTVLHGGSPSLSFGANLAITNCDKAGMPGPRAGIMAGDAELVLEVQAAASELGMEARAPIAAAALRALQAYSPTDLETEARMGAELSDALEQNLPVSVRRSDLGPMIHEDDVHRVVCEIACVDPSDCGLVPAETATAVGMVLLRDHGILTVNTHGQPGARVSFRLKPTLDAIRRAGGVEAVISAVTQSIRVVASMISNHGAIRGLITGEVAEVA